MNKKFTAISLYTGAGGLDYGFESAGFRTAVAVEVDKICVRTLRQNRRWPVIPDDINKVAPTEVLSKGGLKAAEADILIGGPPCQPFSKSGFWAAGDTKRLRDPRAATLTTFLRILEEARPRAFLLENVEGLGFRGKDDGLESIHRQIADINRRHGTNYKLATAVLNAADYGVPQLRRRLFIVAARDGAPFQFPRATHTPDCNSSSNKQPYLTAWDAIGGIRPAKSDDLEVRGKWADLLATIPEGQNYLWHTERGGGEHLFGWRRRYWSFLLKLAKDMPSWTIQAQPGPATGPFHWLNRRLSGPEMARLQTFPKDIVLAGSYMDVQKQLGNAVPSLLAEVLAREISAQLLGRPIAGKLQLAVERRKPPPRPEKLKPVPASFLSLRGTHSPHPGTGKGYRAVNWGTSIEATADELL